MNPFDYVRSVYTKDGKFKEVDEVWVNIYLNKCLVQDKDNADILARVADYTFYLEPTHYFYLLYILIPKKFNFNVMKTPKKTEEDEDQLEAKIRAVLGYSRKEFELNRKQIESTILKDKEYWNAELGVSDVKRRKKAV
jgi:hypothetical protein